MQLESDWYCSVYAVHQGQLCLALATSAGLWEPVTGRMNQGELPEASARRVLMETMGLKGELIKVHQLMSGPQGLLLYHEYYFTPAIHRKAFVFLAEVPTQNISLKKGCGYSQTQWFYDDGNLPPAMLPQVRETWPYAAMAAGIVSLV